MADFVRCPGLEASARAYPEIFKCPVCKSEVEIWSDEKKIRCPACNKLIEKDALKIRAGQKDKRYHVEVKQYRDDSGKGLYFEQYETIIPVSFFEYSDKNKTACEACERFGKNLACPPYSPGFPEFINGQKNAKVISVRVPREYFDQIIQENIYWECCRKAEGLLVEELTSYMTKGYLIAGAGPCTSCVKCAIDKGYEICTDPGNRIYSLESLGVNITALVKRAFDFELDWGAMGQMTDFVCTTGAVFCNKRKI